MSDESPEALVRAAQEAEIGAVKRCVEAGVDVNAVVNGLTALHAACAFKNPQRKSIVSYLLARGADARIATPTGLTALMIAMEWGNTQIVRALAEKSDLDARDGNGRTALMWGLRAMESVEAMRVLLDAGASVDVPDGDGATPLLAAIERASLDVSTLLIERGANPNAQDAEGMTPLMYCARYSGGVDEVVDALIAKGADLDIEDSKGKSAMVHALDHDWLGLWLAEKLIERGVDPETPSSTGETGYDIARRNNNNYLRELLEAAAKRGVALHKKRAKKARPSKSKEQLEKNAALVVAATKGDLTALRAALEDGAEVDAKGEHANTALAIAASAGYVDCVLLLLDRKANVLAEGYCNMTALDLAARDGQADVVRALLDHDAAPTDTLTSAALQIASMSAGSTPGIVAMLQKHRLTIVKPASSSMSPADRDLVEAAHEGNVQGVVTALHDGANIEASDGRGMTALSWAALRGHARVVSCLADKGANLDALNGVGWPALGQACGQGHRDVVDTLIRSGANPNITFDDGKTPLMCAQHEGHEEIVQLLLAAGAAGS